MRPRDWGKLLPTTAHVRVAPRRVGQHGVGLSYWHCRAHPNQHPARGRSAAVQPEAACDRRRWSMSKARSQETAYTDCRAQFKRSLSDDSKDRVDLSSNAEMARLLRGSEAEPGAYRHYPVLPRLRRLEGALAGRAPFGGRALESSILFL